MEKAAADLEVIISNADNKGTENAIVYRNIEKIIDCLENAGKQLELYNSLNKRGDIVSLQSQTILPWICRRKKASGMVSLNGMYLTVPP